VPRFPLQTVLDVTVLRSGIPDRVPGRSLNVCERGMAAVLAQEIVVGETVAIEVQLSSMTSPLRIRAIVRYQDKLRIGLQFVGLSADQRDAIRNWAKEAKAESEVSAHRMFALSTKGAGAGEGKGRGQSLSRGAPGPRKKRFGLGGMIFLVFVAFAVGVFWWRWNQGWEELESGLRNSAMASAEKPQAQVSAEVMQKLLVHRVEPTYPAEAHKANLQGIIALDVIVGRDGSVVKMHALNGPEVLARAAMDALRWWKFEPYRVNGEPAVVETTVAVEFKR
jgi:TonB family protein